MKILCIDDSKAVHSFLKDCVEKVVTEFTSFYDGEDAILYFQKNPSTFDLIFLDWEMPKKTGPETLAELKKLGVKTPVFMLTSKNAVEDISKMLSLGATEYIMKPFTRDIILEKISFLSGF